MAIDKNRQTDEIQICRQILRCLPPGKLIALSGNGFLPLEKNILRAFMLLPLIYDSHALTVHDDI
jgi:hypothetical protein